MGILLFLATCFLAYSNGSNDNFKGVATLLGSKTCDYKVALGWGTLATFLGSLCSLHIAGSLVKIFSGYGLLPSSVAIFPGFLFAVLLGAAATVILASLFGLPVSTTHGLVGALLGAGVMAAGTEINFGILGRAFVLPLLLSPILSLCLASILYLFFRRLRLGFGISKAWCICVGETEKIIPIPEPGPVWSLRAVKTVDASVDMEENCVIRYQGRMLGIGAQDVLTFAHFVNAGAVSFARGLNDTPKILAVLLALKLTGTQPAVWLVAVCMAAGAVFSARHVAETMSHKITAMSQGQGFTANLSTALLVIFASKMGLPVSTTHVSCGSLFGIGLMNGKVDNRVASQIIGAWLLTLPVAALASAAIYSAFGM